MTITKVKTLTTPAGTRPLSDFVEDLLPLEQVSYQTIYMDGSKGLSVFNLPPGWNVGLREKKDTDLTDAAVTVGGTTYTLTKGAALAITSAVGIPMKYVEKTPGPMIQSHLNYWSSHSPEVTIKMLVKGTEALAVAKEGITPFSNLSLIEQANEAMGVLLGETEQPWVSTLSTHDLNISNLRLIIPVQTPEIYETARSSEDTWYPGIQIRNSITGKVPLTVQGFLWNETEQFAMLTEHSAGKYNRKIQGQDLSEVYDWVREATTSVLSDIGHEFEILSSVITEELDSPSSILADVFRSYKVPLKLRQPIMDEFVDAGDETYYGMACAVALATSRAEGMPEHFITTGLRVAGDIVHVGSQRCDSCHRAFV